MNLMELISHKTWKKTKRTLVAGDIIRITDKDLIEAGDDLTDNKEYLVYQEGTSPYITDDVNEGLYIMASDADGYEVLE